MAREKDIIEYIPAGNGEMPPDNDTPETEHDRAAQDLIDHLGELGEGYSVTVHRVPFGNNQTEELCFRCPADKYDPASLQVYIQETYGPGDYRVRVWKNGARGARQNKLITIAKPVATPAVAMPNLSGELGQIMQAMLAMQQQAQAENRALLERLDRRPDPMQEMRMQFALMKEMREAMGIGPAPATVNAAPPVDPIQSLIANLAALSKLKEVAAPFLGGVTEAAEPADTLGTVADVVKSMAPQALQLIKRGQDLKAAEINAAVLTKGGERQPNPAPVVRLDDGPAAADLPEPAKRLLGMLQEYAAQDAETGPIADGLVADARPRPFLEMLLADPRPFKLLASYWPAALDYPDWWLELLEEIRDRLTAGENTGNNGATSVPPGANNNAETATDDPGANS